MSSPLIGRSLLWGICDEPCQMLKSQEADTFAGCEAKNRHFHIYKIIFVWYNQTVDKNRGRLSEMSCFLEKQKDLRRGLLSTHCAIGQADGLRILLFELVV